MILNESLTEERSPLSRSRVFKRVTFLQDTQIPERASVPPHTPHPDLREPVLEEDSGFRNDFSSNP